MASTQELLQKAYTFNRNKHYTQVLALLEDKSLTSLQSADLYAEKALAYYHLGEIDLCYKTVNDALQIDKMQTIAIFIKGAIYMSQKEYDKAMESFRIAIEINPAYAQPYNGLGNLYYRQKEYNKAIESYQKAIEVDPTFALPYNGLGNVYFDQKEYDKAMESYQKASEVDPTYAASYYGLGKVHSVKNEYDKAMEFFRKTIDLDPTYAQPHHGLGNVYYRQKEYNKAIESYQKAIEVDPTYAHPYYGLGNVYNKQKEYDKAIESFQKAIKLEPEFSPHYYGLGNVYNKQKEYDKAIESFQKAIELDPEFDFPYYSRGLLYEDKKEYQKALDDLVRFIELHRTSSNYFTELARDKIIELKKLIANADYTEISELVSKIKDLLLFKGQSVTHYTGMTVAKMLILESSAFRLSEGVFLNDPSEGRELFKFISSIEISNSSSNSDTVAIPFTPKPFIGSFVAETKHDDLTLWRMYGKENKEEARGCAITLDKDQLLQNLKKSLISDNKIESFNDKPDNLNIYDDEFQFYKVAYRQSSPDECFLLPGAEAEEITLLNQYMQELSRKVSKIKSKKDDDLTNIVELLNTIAYLFKSAEYHYEHEIRLIIKGVGFEKKFLEITQPPKVYIELVPIQSIITKITLGPKIGNADEWAAYIYYHLDKVGYNPQIMISHLPFK